MENANQNSANSSMNSSTNQNEKALKASIYYYCLEGLHRTVASLASEGIRMYPGDLSYRFLNGCAFAFETRFQESIRELERCTNDRHLNLGAILALLYAHRKCQVIDHDAVLTLEKRLETSRTTTESNEFILYYAAMFLLFSKESSESEKYILTIRQTYPTFREGKLLQGWHMIYGNSSTVNAGNEHRDKLAKFVNDLDKANDPEVLLVRSKIALLIRDFAQVSTTLNEAIVLYPRFIPALIEKIKLHAAKKEFELLMDTAFRALVLDKHCIEPLRYLILFYLAWDNNEESGLSRLQDLISSLELRESKNSELYYQSARLVARLAFRNRNILLHSFSLIERAIFLDPQSVEYMCEMAHQCTLLGRYQDAQRHYKNAAKLAPDNIVPQVGLLRARLLERESQQTQSNDVVLNRIHEEIDCLVEVNQLISGDKNLRFLALKSNASRNVQQSVIEGFLEQILKLFTSSENLIPYSIEFYCEIDVNQLIDAIEIALDRCPSEPIICNTGTPKMLRFARELVIILLNTFPNHKEILYYAAMVKYLSAEIGSALNIINRSLQYDNTFLQAHLLMAKISIYDRNFRKAHICLENALALDFQIRENIAYILAKANILKYEQSYTEALNLLLTTMENSGKLKFKTVDMLSIQLMIAEIYILLKQEDDADRTLKDLMKRYVDLNDRGRILILSAQFYSVRNDYEGALDRLRAITLEFGLDHFIKSRQLMASIYLIKFKNHSQFIECYQEIVDESNSVQSNLMLGDAYMHILESEKAIAVYEQALKRNPKDYVLIRKVGSALIRAHYYERAVTYYKAAIKSSGHNATFCFDLAQLLAKLKRDGQALEIIEQALKQSQQNYEGDLESFITRMKLQNLLAQVQFRVQSKDVAIQTLRNTHEENQKLMRRLPVENPDLFEEHRLFSVSLCQQLASVLFEHGNNPQKALQIYKDTLIYDDQNSEIYLQMAKIELQNENFDAAHGHCATILKFYPTMEEPILMMADITMRQGDFDGALALYSDLLDKNPFYYIAMMRFIEAARRAGKLDLVPTMFERTKDAVSSARERDPGRNYCQAIYEYYRGNSNEAIKLLFSLRHDAIIGLQASYGIIEICINPDFQSSSFEVLHSLNSNIKFNEKQNASLKMAEMVLEELKNKHGEEFEYLTLRNLTFLSRKQKNDAEYVLSEFMKILSDERYSEHVPSIYGTAAAFMVLKQVPKARNQLKRLLRASWKYSDAEYLEKSWILLADIYIQSNKYEVANDLLRRIIRYNRSCVKSYELIGFIMERESNYRDAAFNYEMAWQYSNQSNPAVGYKLAFNYMKAKRFVDAIDVSQIVLDRYPDYPKIRKDILEKCRASLKL